MCFLLTKVICATIFKSIPGSKKKYGHVPEQGRALSRALSKGKIITGIQYIIPDQGLQPKLHNFRFTLHYGPAYTIFVDLTRTNSQVLSGILKSVRPPYFAPRLIISKLFTLKAQFWDMLGSTGICMTYSSGMSLTPRTWP